MFSPSVLWRAPEINPLNRKARSIPVFNPVDKYGRTFFFSWFGFFIAFWSWYAFPPLLTVSIRADLGLETWQIANTNIAALCGTLIVRFIAGPLCDKFGPRWTFIGILLAGSLPTAMAGLVTNYPGLLALRFFVGILGGSFVPCQVWSTGFFDKNVVGTANALIGGWGNSGGGITFFIMPAIYDSLRTRQGLTSGQSWRVAFIVPFILIVTTALGMVFLCQDTPTGKWSDRHQVLDAVQVGVPVLGSSSGSGSSTTDVTGAEKKGDVKGEKHTPAADIGVGSMSTTTDAELAKGQQSVIEAAKGEVVVAPTFKEAINVIFSLQVLFHCATYVCSFGGELAINSYIGAYYLKNFPYLGQTGSGRWAAMFGLLNVITRPLGGVVGDVLYNKVSKNLWLKKGWISFVGIVSGAFLIAIGLVDSRSESTMFGLIAGMAIFLEAGNGANFALVPHVHPFANGIVSGTVGAAGNLGGVVFAILFRYLPNDYAKAFWVMGIMIIGLNLSVCWIRPVPKGQIGGR